MHCFVAHSDYLCMICSVKMKAPFVLLCILSASLRFICSVENSQNNISYNLDLLNKGDYCFPNDDYSKPLEDSSSHDIHAINSFNPNHVVLYNEKNIFSDTNKTLENKADPRGLSKKTLILHGTSAFNRALNESSQESIKIKSLKTSDNIKIKNLKALDRSMCAVEPPNSQAIDLVQPPMTPISLNEEALESAEEWVNQMYILPSDIYFESCPKYRAGHVVLTYDDGPSPFTEELLDILLEYQVKATFFIIGSSVRTEKDRAIVKRIYDEGHIVASHSYTHPDFTSLTPSEIILETLNTEDIIYQITGSYPRYIRPPYGLVNSEVLRILKRMNYKVLNWNLDSRDWEWHLVLPKKILQNINNELVNDRKSKIIVQHDLHKGTVKMQRKIIKSIIDLKFKIIPLNECFGESSAYHQF